MRKRIVALDMMRGLGVFVVIVIHAIAFNILVPDPPLLKEVIERSHPLLLVILIPLILASSWFTIFIFINGVTLGFSFSNYNRMSPLEPLLKRKTVNGLSLALMGTLFYPLFSQTIYNGGDWEYSSLTGSIYLWKWVPIDWSKFLRHTVLAGIGLSSILVSVSLFFLFTKVNSSGVDNRVGYLTKSLSALTIFALLLSFFIEFMLIRYRIYEALDMRGYSILVDIFSRFFGEQYSVFPQVFFGYAGAVLGVLLASDLEEKKKLIGRGMTLVGVLSIMITALYQLVYPLDLLSIFASDSYPVILHVANFGILLLISLWFIRFFDFSQRASTGRVVQTVTNFSNASMTIYLVESLPAAILYRTFVFIGGSDVFPWNFWIDLLYLVILILGWVLVLRVWKSYNFVGSFEWIMGKILGFFSHIQLTAFESTSPKQTEISD